MFYLYAFGRFSVKEIFKPFMGEAFYHMPVLHCNHMRYNVKPRPQKQ
jgi:hypothetical protein